MVLKNSIRILSFFVVVMLAIPATNVFAKDKQPMSAQEKLVQSMGNDALKELTKKNPTDADRRRQMAKLLDKYFDIKAIARFAMGRNWKKASKKQRSEYVKLFRSMVIETYAERFKEYSGEKFDVTGVKNLGRDVMVHSKVQPEDGPALKIDWRVRDTGGKKYRVIDVFIEGVSMGFTKQAEFKEIIHGGGGDVEVLLAELRK